jgi:hypothetical protein
MKVWVSTFGLYNNGYNVGYWCDATEAPLTVEDFVAGLGAGNLEPAMMNLIGDEVWCFDSESYSYSRELSTAEARKWGEVFVELENLGYDDDESCEAFVLYVNNVWSSIPFHERVEEFEEAYLGKHDSFRDFVMEAAEDSMNIPDNLSAYIDWDAVARDWAYDHSDFASQYGGVHVFTDM